MSKPERKETDIMSPAHTSYKVAFLTRYTPQRASSRVRVYEYLAHLEQAGWQCRVLPFPEKLTFLSTVQYVLGVVRLSIWADVVVMQKLVLQPAFVRLVKRFAKHIIFDFDDAIYTPPDPQAHDEQTRSFYRVRKERLNYTLQSVRRVIVGSHYLAAYARQHQPCVDIIPSSIDIEQYTVKRERTEAFPITIGWIGSPENLADLKPIQQAMHKISERYHGTVVFKVVSSEPPTFDGTPIEFEQWSLEGEQKFLHSFDIGIMPLRDTERSRGRCAFKALQYMAIGLPVVASPVGTACEVVEHGITGFLADTPEAWEASLVQLIEDPHLRLRLGSAGRAKVQAQYSIQSNALLLEQSLRNTVEHTTTCESYSA
jgi:glycosyltransferase involved in cell wall biosynthesis